MSKYTIGYLGPAGSFTWRAAKTFQESVATLVDYDHIEGLFEALKGSTVDLIVVPYENSEQGFVEKHLELFLESGFFACGSTTVDLNFALYRKGGAKDPIKTVWGHPMALKQCASWISNESVEVISASSSTRGVVEVEASEDPGIAAIAPDGLDQLYQVVQIQDHLEGAIKKSTRFLLLSGEAQSVDSSHQSFLMTTRNVPDLLEVLQLSPEKVAYAKCFKDQPHLSQYSYLIELQGCVDSEVDRILDLESAGTIELRGRF